MKLSARVRKKLENIVQLKAELENWKELSEADVLKSLKQKQWILRKKQLSGTARMQLFHTLFHAKYGYGMEPLTVTHKKVRKWFESTAYTALKYILGVKNKVSKDKLFQVCLGRPWACLQSDKNSRLFDKLGIEWCGKLCTCTH